MGRTILIVDIESGSVGCALAHLSPNTPPRLFAETRETAPIFSTRTSNLLIKEIKKSLERALLHTSTIAARARGYKQLVQMGSISQATVFFAPPWAALKEYRGALAWQYEEQLVEIVQTLIGDVFGPIPISLQAQGTATVHATNILFLPQNDFLLCTLMGEVSELILVHNGNLSTRVTLPLGKHLLIRTLQSHAGMSAPEAHSALHLALEHTAATSLTQPLSAASNHFRGEFRDAAKEILGHGIPQGILIIAQKPLGEWFARTLSEDYSLTDVFPKNTTVRALHTQHFMPHIAAHATAPDLLLMIETLFADSQPIGR